MSNNFITPRRPSTGTFISNPSSFPQNNNINKGWCGAQLLTAWIALGVIFAISQIKDPHSQQIEKQKPTSVTVGLVAEVPVWETPALPEVIKRAKFPTGEDIPVQVK